MAFPVFNLRQAFCTVTLNKDFLLFVFSPSFNRREMMCDMSRSRRNMVNVVATTYILVHSFSNLIEEVDIQEFFAGMLC